MWLPLEVSVGATTTENLRGLVTHTLGCLGPLSNPEMLTTFARRVGMPESFTFTDVFGLDEELLMMVPHPCFALTLLFPVAKMGEFKREQRAQIEAAGQTLSPKLFYVTQ
eukprot:9367360-Pyramimonas_sp.AAC.2